MRYFHYAFAIKLLGSFFLISFSLIGFSATFDMDVSGSDQINDSMNRSLKNFSHECFNESTTGDFLAVELRLEGAGEAVSDVNHKYFAAVSSDRAICHNSSSCAKQSIIYHILASANYTADGNSWIFFSGSAKAYNLEPLTTAGEISLNKYAFYSGDPSVRLSSGKIPTPEYQPNNLIFQILN